MGKFVVCAFQGSGHIFFSSSKKRGKKIGFVHWNVTGLLIDMPSPCAHMSKINANAGRHVGTHTHTHTHKHTHKWALTHTRTHTHVRTHLHTHTLIHQSTHTYTHKLIHTNTHTQIQTHTCEIVRIGMFIFSEIITQTAF